MKKNYFIILWENPLSYYFLSNLIHAINLKYNVSLFYLYNQKETDLNIENLKLLKEARIFKVKKTKTFFDKFIYLYFISKIIILIIYRRPKFLYMINRYAVIPAIIYHYISKAKKIYHNLDYNLPKSFYQKILFKLENISYNKCEIIIASHPNRLNYFKCKKNIKKIFFFNSIPRKLFNFNQLKKSNNNNIVYFGSIGPGHGLYRIIKAMDNFNSRTSLFICGWIVDYKYYLSLKKIANKIINSAKIRFMIDIKFKDFKKKIMDCDVGLCIYESCNISHKYMVGASQKMNIYLAAGLPFVTSQNKDFLNFEKKYKCSKSVNISNYKSVAKGIKYLLNNNINLKKSKFAKIAFDEQFNFETQFSRIEKFII